MKYLVHIGYPKAATSWLQRMIFSGVDKRILPLNKSGFVNGTQKSGGEIFYDQNPPKLTGSLKYPYQTSAFGLFDTRQARYEVETRTNPNAVWTYLSNETWTGHPYSGGVHGAIYLQRIKATLPEAKILITVRNPVSAIISAYADYMERQSGLCNFSEFITSNKLNQVPRFQINYFNYMELIKEYDDAFGQENVIVIPFELLYQSPEKFILPLYQSLELSMPTEIIKNEKINAPDYRKLFVYEKLPLINIFGTKSHANGSGALEWGRVHWLASQLHRLITDAASKRHRRFLEGILLNHYGDYLVRYSEALEARMNVNLHDLGYLK